MKKNNAFLSCFVKNYNFAYRFVIESELFTAVTILLLVAAMLSCSGFSPAIAGDIRVDYVKLEKERKIFHDKAEKELKEAAKDAENKEKFIKTHKKTLLAAIKALKLRNNNTKKINKKIQVEIKKIRKKEAAAENALSQTLAANRELSGFILENAKDLKTILDNSLESAQNSAKTDYLTSLINQETSFCMKDISMMTDALFKEIRLSGEVRKTKAVIVDRRGREVESDILILGSFTGIYFLKNEIGFLLYSNKTHRFFALSKLPDSRIKNNLKAYIQGKTSDVYMDISKGAALRHLTHELNLWDQIPKGGPIVWPIIAIFGLAVLIILERIVFFLKRTINADAFMAELEPLVLKQKWEQCRAMLSVKKNRFVPDILLTALEFKDQDRVDIENALQEAILRKIPGIEKFMSTLGMLAAIAPLLGLLGTVTGMINTFHVITYYGTGDPKMMSSGISEALVTTMLGLTVAIPVMLVHTLLSRKVETEIGKMEEKAVSFVNMIFKSRKKVEQTTLSNN